MSDWAGDDPIARPEGPRVLTGSMFARPRGWLVADDGCQRPAFPPAKRVRWRVIVFGIPLGRVLFYMGTLCGSDLRANL